jgi:hypothetical protein
LQLFPYRNGLILIIRVILKLICLFQRNISIPQRSDFNGKREKSSGDKIKFPYRNGLILIFSKF